MSEPQSVSSTDNCTNPETKQCMTEEKYINQGNLIEQQCDAVLQLKEYLFAVLLQYRFCCFSFSFFLIASFSWVPQMWDAGVRKETAVLHWLLVSLPFLYWVDSYLKIITCLLCIVWNLWQWMDTVVWSNLFCWLDTGGSFISLNAHLFPVL